MQLSAPIPDPLRGNEVGTFTHHSVVVRLPEIAERVLDENDLSPTGVAAMESLIDEIDRGAVVPLTERGPNQPEWDSYVAPHVRMSWRDVPWFFAEYYFYRRVLDAVGFWDSGNDPFRDQKQLGLAQALPAAREALVAIDASYARGVSTQSLLLQVTDAALWGNQVDLSLWPAEDGVTPEPSMEAHKILVDDRPSAIWALHDRLPPANVDIVLDNAGAELVADLILADLLLRSDLAAIVRLHAKAYPIFVSDSTESDVADSIDRMTSDDHPHLRSVGERLQGELTVGRLIISSHPFWVSPLGWRDRPADLDLLLSEAGLIIVKGDANYRRLVDDRHWSFTTPFAEAIESTPAPLLALRTIKSEVAVGLEADAVTDTAAQDPLWLQNGQWALANFAGIQAVI